MTESKQTIIATIKTINISGWIVAKDLLFSIKYQDSFYFKLLFSLYRHHKAVAERRQPNLELVQKMLLLVFILLICLTCTLRDFRNALVVFLEIKTKPINGLG